MVEEEEIELGDTFANVLQEELAASVKGADITHLVDSNRGEVSRVTSFKPAGVRLHVEDAAADYADVSVQPHVIRIVAGPDHRLLLPAAALGGGALLVGADMAARIAVAPAELPIGIVTALIGAPYFLWLLLRRGTSLDA